MSHLFIYVSQTPLLRSLLDVAVLMLSGGLLYVFWEKVLGR